MVRRLCFLYLAAFAPINTTGFCNSIRCFCFVYLDDLVPKLHFSFEFYTSIFTQVVENIDLIFGICVLYPTLD